MAAKTLLIIGGAGYIGSHINLLLNQRGYKTVVLDDLSKGHRNAVIAGTFIEGKMEDSNTLHSIFDTYTIDAVIHCAAYIDVGESMLDPAKYYENNVVNTLKLLQVMQECSIRYFLFSSTAAIFGVPQECLITENHPKIPINPYGRTKLIVENMLTDFDVAYGIKSCSLRYFNAAGGDPKKILKNYKKSESNLIPIILRSLKFHDGVVTINGNDYDTPDGTCIRDYIHVFDLADAHILALEQLFKTNQSTVYNLGNGQGFSVKEVIDAAENVTGRKVERCFGPRRKGDPPILLADSKRAYQDLNWNPQYPSLNMMVEHAWSAL